MKSPAENMHRNLLHVFLFLTHIQMHAKQTATEPELIGWKSERRNWPRDGASVCKQINPAVKMPVHPTCNVCVCVCDEAASRCNIFFPTVFGFDCTEWQSHPLVISLANVMLNTHR